MRKRAQTVKVGLQPAVVHLMRRLKDTERGATLIEAAFVTLPFMLVVFAILEFGLAFRTDLTIENAGQRGSRSASVAGRAPIADYLIIEAIKDGLDDGGIHQVERIIVYKAASPSDPIPAGCLAITNPIGAAGVPGVCNVYGPDALSASLETSPGVPSDQWQCITAASRDFNWCPTLREVSFSGDRDYIGVYVETTHEYLTGFFGSSVELESNTISRLEPETE